MYENIIYDDEFTEEELLGFRACLREEYRELDDETLEELLEQTLAGMTVEDAQLWEGWLKKLGRVASRALPTVLPAAGAAVGSLIAPGVGTAVGGALGKVAGQALGKATVPTKPIAPPKAPAQMPAARSTTATTQLLQLLQSPQLLQALGSLGLGTMGRQSIPVGSGANVTSASPTAILNLIGSLTQRAALEAVQLETAESVASYLLDKNGKPLGDVANPEERARILWEQLQQDETFLMGTEFLPEEREYEDYDVVDWLVDAGLAEREIVY